MLEPLHVVSVQMEDEPVLDEHGGDILGVLG
jgi:hypothetical protein